jgi:hypothetical protein
VTGWQNRPVTSSDPWQPPGWAGAPATTFGLLPPGMRSDVQLPVDWRTDLRRLLLTTVAVALSGPVAGLVWRAVAPTVSIRGLLLGSESTLKAEIGADVWFLLVGAAAGVLCAAVAAVLRAEGPGVVLGLAVGGVLGSLVADRVGYLAAHGATAATLAAFGVPPGALQRAGLDPFLEVRALGVLLAWPLAAVVVHALAASVRARRD